jgi:hypothetical protein
LALAEIVTTIPDPLDSLGQAKLFAHAAYADAAGGAAGGAVQALDRLI